MKNSSRFIPREAVRRAPQIVADYNGLEVSAHPFFVGLRARPVDLSALWLLMANIRAGISHDFVVWLAQTIVRVDDNRIRSLLAKQLDDELGSGDFPQIHSVLLDRFVLALEPWRPADADDGATAPGRRVADEGNRVFHTSEPYEAVGALIVGEIFAEKMDHCVGDEIRRQQALSPHALTWLTIHEVLEADHAGDSHVLAELVPDSRPILEATWRGATAHWRALWELLDGVESIASTARGRIARELMTHPASPA